MGSGSTPNSNGVFGQADLYVHILPACLVSSVNAGCFNNGLIKKLKEKVWLCNKKNGDQITEFWVLSDLGPCAS